MTGAFNLTATLKLTDWIKENRHLLKPPVGNKCIWPQQDFIVMAVGGPNERTDFHVNCGDEFFHQIEGDMILKIRTPEGQIKDVSIKQGDIYLLPAHTPHSPQRPADTIGLVIERRRQEGERDGLQWYCERCGDKLYEEFFKLENIETQFKAVFDRYYDSPHTKCKNCGTVNGRKWNHAKN
ncbi:MAG: 3-hydroxyanthranilate 3,4-dioxygenase [Bdellovibrionaceae bacterium]|nr:3-hydroxyanthranilate 3,4-dioxygenase [Pseudobdellovibrionaceae bacterium]